MRVRIYPTDVMGKGIYVNGVHERREANFVTRYLSSGMVFLDIGANLGQYTLLAAQKVTASGQVHSFEPSERMFAELSFNVQLNSISRFCSLNRLAVSDKIGHTNLSRYSPGAEVFSSLGNHSRVEAKVIGYDPVETITLDAYIQHHGIQHVDLIKMDIEGAELPALKGGRRLLLRPDAPAIILEMADVNTAGFGYRALEIWELLISLGYSFYELDAFSRTRPIQQPPSFGGGGVNLVAMKQAPVQRGQLNRR
jgi:FkbM family methyltransferase